MLLLLSVVIGWDKNSPCAYHRVLEARRIRK